MSRPNFFVAIPVAAGPWFDGMEAPGAGVRRFAASDLHITVAFLGGVGETSGRAAFDLAEGWPTGPLRVRLGEVRAMGNPRRASALSAMVHPGPGSPGRPLEAAMASVRGAMLERAGAVPDRRPPLPHVTLARITRRAGRDERRAALDWAARVDLGSPMVELTRIALYTWSSDRRASLFQIIDERPLLRV